ncbi:hypothetical protein BJ508DRAFT_381353 [Ascobolus immersus RN42]|uniref:Uncharacterized protein n=1 Tax=Ascobolus immersus RN42 TaxID=1160509 RepID=A0A3N4HLV5_ASCIM|nr:hypothetical protein BJ508DRAFT_381353 [Ascobolus immersus RN42]
MIDRSSLLTLYTLPQGPIYEQYSRNLLRHLLTTTTTLSTLPLSLHPPLNANLQLGSRKRDPRLPPGPHTFTTNWPIIDTIARLELFLILLKHLLPPPPRYPDLEPGMKYTVSLHAMINNMKDGLWYELSCLVPCDGHPGVKLGWENERFRKGLARGIQIELIERWLDVVMGEIRDAFWVLCGFDISDDGGVFEVFERKGVRLEDFRGRVELVERYFAAFEAFGEKGRRGSLKSVERFGILGGKCWPGVRFLVGLRCESVEVRIGRYLCERDDRGLGEEGCW